MRVFLWIALAFGLTILIGCLLASTLLPRLRRDNETFARSTLESIGATHLSEDAAKLAKATTETPGLPIGDPNSLPASFRLFKPVETLRYDNCFLIVIERWMQHREGVLVQPADYGGPPSAYGNDTYEELAPNIYFHRS